MVRCLVVVRGFPEPSPGFMTTIKTSGVYGVYVSSAHGLWS